MARADIMTAEDTAEFERGRADGLKQAKKHPARDDSVHYWQGYVSGCLELGWEKRV